MQIFLIQYLVPIVGLFAVAGAIMRYRKREMSRALLIVWTLLWVGLSAVVQLPQKTDILARLLGVGRGVDVLVFLSIIVIFLIQYRSYLRLERMERDITKVVREIALRDKKE